MRKIIPIIAAILGLPASFSRAAEPAVAGVPAGAAALGYTKRIINEAPTAADIAPGRNGDYKWFSGQWYAKTVPTLERYETQAGVLALKLGGDLVSATLDP